MLLIFGSRKEKIPKWKFKLRSRKLTDKALTKMLKKTQITAYKSQHTNQITAYKIQHTN